MYSLYLYILNTLYSLGRPLSHPLSPLFQKESRGHSRVRQWSRVFSQTVSPADAVLMFLMHFREVLK